MVILKDLSPGIEQVYDAVLDAAQAFLPLSLVHNWLLANPFEEDIEKLAFERRPNVRDLLGALRRSHLRLGMTRQPHERTRKTPVERSRREGRDTPHLHRAVERL